jgi:hypothetical protein
VSGSVSLPLVRPDVGVCRIRPDDGPHVGPTDLPDATLGQIGFAERVGNTAIGTVTNLAARLCGEAKDGQILVGRRVAVAVEETASLEKIGDLALKGLSQPVAVYGL